MDEVNKILSNDLAHRVDSMSRRILQIEIRLSAL